MLSFLQNHRLPGLDLGERIVYPAYQGHSILNIPASLCHFLGVPEIGHNASAGPLSAETLSPLDSDYQHVILVLMDALAFHRLEGWMQDGTAPIWTKLAQDGLLHPLTSIVPSTTSTALTSLWTGCPTSTHGITGYEMWLKEYGVVANTILHTPMAFQNDVDGLERAGFKAEEFLSLTTLGSHLVSQGVNSYVLMHKSLAHSGLSRMLFKDTDFQAFFSAADLWINLRHLLDSKPNEKLYAWVYWSEVDHFGHVYGPDDERTAAEFSNFSLALERLFLAHLSPPTRHKTLLILTADHGQITTSANPHYDLRNHPNLVRRLHINPTGENRLAFLYVRPGQYEAVREYIERAWPNQFTLIESTYALELGLFGSGGVHPSLLDRLGDLCVLAGQDAYLWWASKDNSLIGRHGGLSPEEMLVPFLAVPLG
jgi:predicted AlkP superfamily pyrophosphatase or phosphodiesterase